MKKLLFTVLLATTLFSQSINACQPPINSIIFNPQHGTFEQQNAIIDRRAANVINALHYLLLNNSISSQERSDITAQALAVHHNALLQAHMLYQAHQIYLQKQQAKKIICDLTMQKDAWDIGNPLDMTNFTLPNFTTDELPSPTSITGTNEFPSNLQQSQSGIKLRNRKKNNC